MAYFIPANEPPTAVSKYLPLGPEVTTNVEVAPAEPGYTPVYRNKATRGSIIKALHPKLTTYNALFNNAAQMYADRPCMGSRKYNYSTHQSGPTFESLTYKQVNERKRNLGSGIIYSLSRSPYLSNSEAHQKIKHHLNDYSSYGSAITGVGNENYELEKSTSFILSIFSSNRMEWLLTDLACSAYAITNTALYDNLGAEVTKFILELTKSPIVVCSCDKVEQLLEFKRDHPDLLSDLISIIVMDPKENIRHDLFARANQLKVEISDINEIEKLGEAHRLDELEANPESLYTISFTSGTTGSKPKGAMISQACAAAGGTVFTSFSSHASVNEKAFIFLPLTHIYERQTSAFALITGYYLGFPSLQVGSTRPRDAFTLMLDDLRVFKPTYFSIVPRLLNKMESFIKNAIEHLEPEQRLEVNRIVEYKTTQQAQHDGATGEHYYYDNYAPYRNLKHLVGFDNLKWTQTGSAPVAPSTIVYLKAALGVGIRSLYGMTETFACMSSSGVYEQEPGSCGASACTMEFRLQEIPSMNYHVDEGKGELLVRGTTNFKGYYYNIEETKKMFDKDGWLHTGDIAHVEPGHNRMYIIDRVKNFFKLAQGEYVSPEKVENKYLSSNPCINQLFVHGDSVRSFVVGVAGIEYAEGLKFLSEYCGFKSTTRPAPEELLHEINKVANKKKFLERLNRGVGSKLTKLEMLHNIHIDINPLTVERDVVTPTQKIKRVVAAKFFKDVIHRLYVIEQSLFAPARAKL